MSKLGTVRWAAGLVVLLIAGCGSSSKPAAESTKPKPTPATAGGEVAAPAPALPAAAEVLDRYVEVTGGKAAYQKVTSMVTLGKFTMPTMNLGGEFVGYMAAPRKLHFLAKIPGIGDQERGTDGEIAWEKATMTGNRIIEGNERAEFLRDATFNADLVWRDLFTKAETVGLEAVDGKPAYALVLTTPEGSTETRFYDQASGLLVRSEKKMETNMGVIPVETTISDYRPVGDLMVPFSNSSKMMGMEQVLTIDKVEFNVAIPPDRFAIPADIAALAAGAGAAPTAPPTKKPIK